jgi:type II secretion system protein H
MRFPANSDGFSRPAGGRRREHEGGFQLVELAVVLVIFGILMAVATPSLNRGNSWRRIEGAARDLGARMQSARQASICARVPYRMVLDREGARYAFERQQQDSSWVRSPDVVFPLEGAAEFRAIIGGSESATLIRFETRGTVQEDDSPVLIRLFDAQNDTATVSMVRTGRVTVRMSRAAS